MDDYHEFKCTHEIQIKEWQVYRCLNYVSSLRELWPQVVQWQLLTLVWQVEIKAPMVMEPPKMVEPLEMVEVLRVVV